MLILSRKWEKYYREYFINAKALFYSKDILFKAPQLPFTLSAMWYFWIIMVESSIISFSNVNRNMKNACVNVILQIHSFKTVSLPWHGWLPVTRWASSSTLRHVEELLHSLKLFQKVFQKNVLSFEIVFFSLQIHKTVV
jgi:hypothetical protein